MDVPPAGDQSSSGAEGASGEAGPSGPWSGEAGPSGPWSGEAGPSGPWSGAEELDWRLAGIEGRLDAISERVERLESSVRGAVADEVRAATDGLRRTIAQLGRLLVKDLPHELARHRDTIVAELRPPPAPEPVEPTSEPEPVEPDGDGAASIDITEEPDPEGTTVPASAEQPERRRSSRLRRRHG